MRVHALESHQGACEPIVRSMNLIIDPALLAQSWLRGHGYVEFVLKLALAFYQLREAAG